MRILEWVFKVIAAIMLLIIPFLLIYWILSSLPLEPVKPLAAMLGTIVQPFLSIFERILGHRTFNIMGLDINLIPLIVSGLLLVLSLLANAAAKAIEAFTNSLNYVTAKTKVHMVQKQKEEEKKQEDKKLMENSVAYVVVRYKSQTTSSAYLASSGLSSDDIKEMFLEHFNRYSYLDAQLHKDSTEENYLLIFEDIPNSLTFALTLQENVVKLNKSLDKTGMKIIVTAGVYCTSPMDSKQQAFFIANKVCNLAAPGQVDCSKEVKSIFERDRSDHNLKFISKGMYDLGSEIEIFSVQKFL